MQIPVKKKEEKKRAEVKKTKKKQQQQQQKPADYDSTTANFSNLLFTKRSTYLVYFRI